MLGICGEFFKLAELTVAGLDYPIQKKTLWLGSHGEKGNKTRNDDFFSPGNGSLLGRIDL